MYYWWEVYLGIACTMMILYIIKFHLLGYSHDD